MPLPQLNVLPVTAPSLLFFADTQRSADLRYFAGFEVHDPFIAVQVGAKKIGVFNALEFGRALKESAFDQVLPLEPLAAAATARRGDQQRASIAEIILELARKLKRPHFVVPADFPAFLYAALLAGGLEITLLADPVFPAREIKTVAEARAIREGNRCAAAGLATAEKLLRAATIRGRRLLLDGKPLTSERVRHAIEIACLAVGGYPADTIVAGGDQACDPHCRGTGPLRAHELIIVDIFPRIIRTGYHGDMTRTFLRGSATTAQRKLVDAVAAAQRAALARVRAEVDGAHVHAACTETFTARGYATTRTTSGATGFFHGTGHGLGLAIHEAPRVNAHPQILRAGTVVTIEPGLYYPGLGGCRIEDVVQVNATGPRFLSRYPYTWELA